MDVQVTLSTWISLLNMHSQNLLRAFMVDAASQAGDTDCAWLSCLTSVIQQFFYEYILILYLINVRYVCRLTSSTYISLSLLENLHLSVKSIRNSYFTVQVSGFNLEYMYGPCIVEILFEFCKISRIVEVKNYGERKTYGGNKFGLYTERKKIRIFTLVVICIKDLLIV